MGRVHCLSRLGETPAGSRGDMCHHVDHMGPKKHSQAPERGPGCQLHLWVTAAQRTFTVGFDLTTNVLRALVRLMEGVSLMAGTARHPSMLNASCCSQRTRVSLKWTRRQQVRVRVDLDTRGAGLYQWALLCLRTPQHRAHLRPRATKGRSAATISHSG